MDAELSKKVDELAEEIFDSWDVDREGVVFSDDIIHASDVCDEEFGTALARVLCKDNSGKIYAKDLSACLKTLKYGNLEAQVSLLIKFMDRNCSGNISLSTIQSYLQVSDDKLLERLGLSGTNTDIQYEDMLGLFSKTERGPDAINVFCNQIIRILMKQTKVKKQNLTDHMSLKHFSLPRDRPSSTLLDDLSALMKRVYDHFTVSSLTKSMLSVLQVFLWCLNVHYYHGRSMPWSFCFAKGFGLNLRVLTIILFLSMARTTLAKLNNFPFLRPFIFSGHNIQAHAFCGSSTFVHAFGHAIMHIWYQVNNREGGFVESFEQKSMLGGLLHLRWQFGDDVASGDGYTGVLLLGLIIVITVSERDHQTEIDT
jgi:Ca2+-binding EF-hand superfamily protein